MLIFMPTVCIQCALKALVAGEPAPIFDEAPDVHAARVHPDLRATATERIALLAALEAARRAGPR
jgi:hypothetical protein